MTFLPHNFGKVLKNGSVGCRLATTFGAPAAAQLGKSRAGLLKIRENGRIRFYKCQKSI